MPILWCVLLGKLYVKKRLWDLAEKELRSAEQILKESNTLFCCSKCKLKLEVTLYEYLGDLCQSKFDTCDGVMSEETAKNWYTSALDKLNLSEWKNPLSCPEDGSDGTATDIKCPAGKTCTCFIMNEVGESVKKSMKAGRETEIGAKQNRKTKNAAKVLPKEPNLVVENKSRLTRSRYRSSQNQYTSIHGKLEVHESLEGNHVSDSSDMLSQNGSVLSNIGCTFASRCAITCVFSKMKCWYCLPSEVVKSGLLNDFINLKWEFVRRQHSMKLLSRVGMSALSYFLLFILLLSKCKCYSVDIYSCFFKLFCIYTALFFE